MRTTRFGRAVRSPGGRLDVEDFVCGCRCELPCLALALGLVSEAAENATSVWEGVYTKEQAARGKTRYFAACAVCHGPALQGDSDSPELAGKSFMKRWGDQSVGTLFAFASSQMPVGRPRSLGQRELPPNKLSIASSLKGKNESRCVLPVSISTP